MVKSNHTPLVDEQYLPNQLRWKSRRRRKSSRNSRRCLRRRARGGTDPLPQIELASIKLDELHLPARKTRKCNPAHVREVMNSISALGFVIPSLSVR